MGTVIRKLDYVVITWLIIKLMCDTGVFIYFLQRVPHDSDLDYSVAVWLATKLVLNTGVLIYFIWRVSHHGQHGSVL